VVNCGGQVDVVCRVSPSCFRPPPAPGTDHLPSIPTSLQYCCPFPPNCFLELCKAPSSPPHLALPFLPLRLLSVPCELQATVQCKDPALLALSEPSPAWLEFPSCLLDKVTSLATSAATPNTPRTAHQRLDQGFSRVGDVKRRHCSLLSEELSCLGVTDEGCRSRVALTSRESFVVCNLRSCLLHLCTSKRLPPRSWR
jgi:hypothetical protein